MLWKKRILRRKNRKNIGKNKYFSISRKLKTENKLTPEMEILFHSLSLEDVIALKLELSSKLSFNHKIYGLPIWHSLIYIVKDAILKYALSATSSKKEAASFLGLKQIDIIRLTNIFKSDNYFIEEQDSS